VYESLEHRLAVRGKNSSTRAASDVRGKNSSIFSKLVLFDSVNEIPICTLQNMNHLFFVTA
jgi:hypothetical protein